MRNYQISNFLNSDGKLTCSVCGKEFKPNDDTKYIISGGYTCSWKCFLKESKRLAALKAEENKDKKPRGRKKKI